MLLLLIIDDRAIFQFQSLTDIIYNFMHYHGLVAGIKECTYLFAPTTVRIFFQNVVGGGGEGDFHEIYLLYLICCVVVQKDRDMLQHHSFLGLNTKPLQ